MDQPVLTDLFVVEVEQLPDPASSNGRTSDFGSEDRGSSPRAGAPFQPGSHSSWTGARAVVECFAERQAEILQLLAGGPKSRQELEGLTRYKINSICSCVGALLKRGLIERTGDYDTFVDSQGHVTRRERLRVAKR